MTNVAEGSVGRSDLFSQNDVVDAAEFGDLIFTMPGTQWDSFEDELARTNTAFFFPFQDIFRTCCGTTHNLQNCMNKFVNNWFSWHLELPNLCVFLRRTLRTCIPKQGPTLFPAPVHLSKQGPTLSAPVNILNRLPHLFHAGQHVKDKVPHYYRSSQKSENKVPHFPALVAISKEQAPTLFPQRSKFQNKLPHFSTMVNIQKQGPTLFLRWSTSPKQGPSPFPHWTKPTQGPTLFPEQSKSNFRFLHLFTHRSKSINKVLHFFRTSQNNKQGRTLSARIEVPKQAPTLSALVHIPKTRSLRLSWQHNDCV